MQDVRDCSGIKLLTIIRMRKSNETGVFNRVDNSVKIQPRINARFRHFVLLLQIIDATWKVEDRLKVFSSAKINLYRRLLVKAIDINSYIDKLLRQIDSQCTFNSIFQFFHSQDPSG